MVPVGKLTRTKSTLKKLILIQIEQAATPFGGCFTVRGFVVVSRVNTIHEHDQLRECALYIIGSFRFALKVEMLICNGLRGRGRVLRIAARRFFYDENSYLRFSFRSKAKIISLSIPKNIVLDCTHFTHNVRF